jgi:hypothetical protein
MKNVVLVLVIAFGLILASTSRGAEYQVPKGHPRIFILAEDVPGLAKSCSPGGLHAEDYAKLKEYVDHESEVMRHSAPSFAFVYLIEKQLGHPTETYLAPLKKHILEMAQKDMLQEDNWHHYQSLIAADWVWDTWSDAEKQQLARGMRIEEASTWPYRYYHENVPCWRPGAPGRVLARLIRSLCFSGEGIADEKVKAELDRCYEYVTRELGPALNLSGGPDPSGFGYATFTEIWSGWHFPIWERLGVDVWKSMGTDSRPNIWGTQFPEWYLYSQVPFEPALLNRDDSTLEPISGMSPLSAPLFLQAGSKAARWWVERLSEKGIFAAYLWAKIIWDDGSVPPVKLEEFPSSKYFASGEGPRVPASPMRAGMGEVVWRSGWGEDASLFDFRCGDYYYGHQHLDTGSFILNKSGYLAIDPGPYFTYATANAEQGTAFDENYHHAPVAHNLVAFFRRDGEPIRQRLPEPSDPAYYMFKERPADFDHGDILAYEDTEHYAYVLGDVTPAYDNSSLKKQLRAIVYLKPDTFVIYDRVLTEPIIVKRWLLHTKNAPKVAGGTPAVIEGSAAQGIVEYPDASRITAVDRSGMLTAAILLPKGALARTIGGDGYRYWVNGRDYFYGELKDEGAQRSLQAKVPMIGWGRVEVMNEAPDATFLTVLHVQPVALEVRPVTAELVEEGDRVGAKVVGATVLFSRELPITGHITISDRSGKTLVDAALATEVKPEPYRP